jgi:hypothetical protein
MVRDLDTGRYVSVPLAAATAPPLTSPSRGPAGTGSSSSRRAGEDAQAAPLLGSGQQVPWGRERRRVLDGSSCGTRLQ